MRNGNFNDDGTPRTEHTLRPRHRVAEFRTEDSHTGHSHTEESRTGTPRSGKAGLATILGGAGALAGIALLLGGNTGAPLLTETSTGGGSSTDVAAAQVPGVGTTVGALGNAAGTPAANFAGLVPGTELRAAPLPNPSSDLDGDGLCDEQEAVLHTDPFMADTDGDGYGDGEEFARQSDPVSAISTPLNSGTNGPSAALTARGESGKLRLVLGVHEPEFQHGDAWVRIGVFASQQVFEVPVERLISVGQITEVGGTANSTLTVIDLPINPDFVHLHGTASFFVATGSFTTQTLDNAAKIDVLSDGETLFLQASPRPTDSGRQTSQGGGTIRQPLPVESTIPPESSWISGAVCYQRSEVIGVNGARMLHQVIEADCVTGWDSFCSGDCAASVGETYETVDPWSLIGG